MTSHGRGRHWVSAVEIPLILAVMLVVALVAPASPSSNLSSASNTVVPLTHASLTSGGGWALQQDGFATTGISCANAATCLAVGNMGEGEDHKDEWFHREWTCLVCSHSNRRCFHAFGVSCPSASVCVALGKSNDSSPVPIVEQTTNGGSGWSPVSMPSPMTSMTSISCPTSTACVVGGVELVSGISYVVAVTLTPGSSPTWGTPYQLVGGTTFGGLSCTSSGYCGVITNSDAFFYSTNNGVSWTGGATAPPAGRGNDYTNIGCSGSGTSATCVIVGYCPGTVAGCYSAFYGNSPERLIRGLRGPAVASDLPSQRLPVGARRNAWR